MLKDLIKQIKILVFVISFLKSSMKTILIWKIRKLFNDQIITETANLYFNIITIYLIKIYFLLDIYKSIDASILYRYWG